MSNRFAERRPPYPIYGSQPMFGGKLPSIVAMGPKDMWPSATNPSYDTYAGAHGRNFAGLGKNENMQDSADPGIQSYPNELDLLAAADDVQGNGVFDPNGTQGNLHPDLGVFADHENQPGYLVRERFYEPSGVIDGTTGAPVMYVPGGAVAIDQSQLDTIRERQLLWELPPGVSPQRPSAPSDGGTWIPDEPSWAISGLRGLRGEDVAGGSVSPSAGVLALSAIAGVAVGLVALTIWPRR